MLSLLSTILKSLHNSKDNPRLFPLDDRKYPAEIGPTSPSDEGDRSYADALLDLQVHSFFHSEYGGAEPPDYVFQAVLRSIRELEQPRPVAARQPRTVSLAAAIMGKLQNAFGSAVASRLVPSGVALMLLVSVLSSDVRHLLGANVGLRQDYRPATTTLAPVTFGPPSFHDPAAPGSSFAPAQDQGNSRALTARSTGSSMNIGETYTEDAAPDDAIVSEEEARAQRMAFTRRYIASSAQDGDLENYKTPRYGPQ